MAYLYVLAVVLLFSADLACSTVAPSCEDSATAQACELRLRTQPQGCTDPGFRATCPCVCDEHRRNRPVDRPPVQRFPVNPQLRSPTRPPPSTSTPAPTPTEVLDQSLCADYPASKMAYDCEFRVAQNPRLCSDPAYRCLCRCTCAVFTNQVRLVESATNSLLNPLDILALSSRQRNQAQNQDPDRCPDYEGSDAGRTCIWRVSRLGKRACTGLYRRLCPCTCRNQENDELCPDAPWEAMSGECQLRAGMNQCSNPQTREHCPCTCAFMETCPGVTIAVPSDAGPNQGRPLPFNPDSYPAENMPGPESQNPNCMDTATSMACRSAVMNGRCSSMGPYCMASCGLCSDVQVPSNQEPFVNQMPDDNMELPNEFPDFGEGPGSGPNGRYPGPQPQNPPYPDFLEDQFPEAPETGPDPYVYEYETEDGEDDDDEFPPSDPNCMDMAPRSQCLLWQRQSRCNTRWPMCRMTCNRCQIAVLPPQEPEEPEYPEDQDGGPEVEEPEEPEEMEEPEEPEETDPLCLRCQHFELQGLCAQQDRSVLLYCQNCQPQTCRDTQGPIVLQGNNDEDDEDIDEDDTDMDPDFEAEYEAEYEAEDEAEGDMDNPDLDDECIDMHPSCAEWAEINHCAPSATVREYCPRSCGLCPGQMTPQEEAILEEERILRAQGRGEHVHVGQEGLPGDDGDEDTPLPVHMQPGGHPGDVDLIPEEEYPEEYPEMEQPEGPGPEVQVGEEFPEVGEEFPPEEPEEDENDEDPMEPEEYEQEEGEGPGPDVDVDEGDDGLPPYEDQYPGEDEDQQPEEDPDVMGQDNENEDPEEQDPEELDEPLEEGEAQEPNEEDEEFEEQPGMDEDMPGDGLQEQDPELEPYEDQPQEEQPEEESTEESTVNEDGENQDGGNEEGDEVFELK